MNIKPTTTEAQSRLRLDDELTADLESAIEQAYSLQLNGLDRVALHPDQEALDAALALDAEHTGIVVTPSLIAAQLLRIDVLIGSNSLQERESKQTAAQDMERLHAKVGA